MAFQVVRSWRWRPAAGAGRRIVVGEAHTIVVGELGEGIERGVDVSVVVVERFGGTGRVLLFADREELAEGRHGGDGYSDVLFKAASLG